MLTLDMHYCQERSRHPPGKSTVFHGEFMALAMRGDYPIKERKMAGRICGILQNMKK